MSEVWTRWEGRVINGTFPLLRCLGTSDHSGVFLTEHTARGFAKAALKLVPALPTLTEAQLSHWSAAAGLSHPRLIRLYDTGRCQLGELPFLFVVMEYAEQNLAEVLPHRALSAAEAREMLLPTLDALSCLHGRGLVQGHLKPSNILVVGDQLKVASDTIRPAQEATAHIGMPSVYDAPETERGNSSTAADIWALGATLVAALTQRPPSWSDEPRANLVLPPDFPQTFTDTVRRCLSHEPAGRPSVTDLVSWIEGRPRAPAIAPSEPAARAPGLGGSREVPAPGARGEVPGPGARGTARPVTREATGLPVRQARPFVPVIVGAVALVVAGWAAVHLISSHRSSQAANDSGAPSQSAASEQPAPGAQETLPPVPPARSDPATASGPASNTKSADAKQATSSSVVHEEIPKVPRSARDTISGHIRVAVRVTVDRSGSVVSEVLDDPGPSRYFARLATQAARRWKFVPVDDTASREWLVRFEFSRAGTTGHAVRARPR